VLIRVPPPSGVGALGYPDPLTPATFPLILPAAAAGAALRAGVSSRPEGVRPSAFGATHRHANLGPPSVKLLATSRTNVGLASPRAFDAGEGRPGRVRTTAPSRFIQ